MDGLDILQGARFGRLTAMTPFYAKWICQCDCGEYVLVSLADLRAGRKKDCGCATRQPRRSGEVYRIMERNGMLN